MVHLACQVFLLCQELYLVKFGGLLRLSSTNIFYLEHYLVFGYPLTVKSEVFDSTISNLCAELMQHDQYWREMKKTMSFPPMATMAFISNLTCVWTSWNLSGQPGNMTKPGWCLGSDHTLGQGPSERIQTRVTGMMTDIFTDNFRSCSDTIRPFRHCQSDQTTSN